MTANDDQKRSPVQRLCEQLATRGLLTDRRELFDDFNRPVPALKGLQIDRRPASANPFSDQGAALSNVQLFLVVSGEVEPTVGAHQVTIRKLGVFMEDNYDFEGHQPLGVWNVEDLSVGINGCSISNGSFRDWRSVTGFGGDFLVYSDLKVTDLGSSPYVFMC
jgi:hypothetical protein